MINLNALPLAGDRASLLAVLGGLTDPRAGRGIRRMTSQPRARPRAQAAAAARATRATWTGLSSPPTRCTSTARTSSRSPTAAASTS
ncbi:MAG: hypothetical protein ACLP52_08175 [Streptosporangiaceae bacterium]